MSKKFIEIEIDRLEGRVRIDPADLRTASYAVVLEVLQHHQALYLQWAERPHGYDPLLLDAFTASALKTVHDAIQDQANVAKFERMIAASRVQFGKIVDFCWTCVK